MLKYVIYERNSEKLRCIAEHLSARGLFVEVNLAARTITTTASPDEINVARHTL